MSSKGQKYKNIHKNRICHGEGKTRLHNMWTKMIDRCDRPKERNYGRYGGKGIRTWEGWKLKGGVGFLAFKEHLLSLHPDLYSLLDQGYEIDRIDSKGHYEPGNVRMVTPVQNQRNKCNNIYVLDVDGSKISFCDFWEKYHLPEVTYKQAYDRFGSRKSYKDPMKAVRTVHNASCSEDLLIKWEDYWISPKQYCDKLGLKTSRFNWIRLHKNVSIEEASQYAGPREALKEIE